MGFRRFVLTCGVRATDRFCNRATALRVVLLVFLLQPGARAETGDNVVRLYLDADRTHLRESARAIEWGVRVALHEVHDTVAGYRVELVCLDHRGNSARSRFNLELFLQDDRALAVVAGLHSPPLLTHRDFINTQRIPVLVPWAAATAITRYPSEENWIFRLSVDDRTAGTVIVSWAVGEKGCKRPALLLEDTGWGRANHATMAAALERLGRAPACTVWFDWGLTEPGARDKLRRIARDGADGIVLVANAPEAKVIARALLALPPEQRLPLYSHWGLTGGDFPRVITQEMRQGLELYFIQTRFFMHSPLDPFAAGVFATAVQLFPVTAPADIEAPAGFVHACDLTRLLIAAIAQSGLTGDIRRDRDNLRQSLENIREPVRGLVTTYIRPFRPFHPGDPDAHEALGAADFVMARYGPNGEILPAH